MYKFSKVSMSRLTTCHPDLQALFKEVIKQYDCSILCGHRTQQDQAKAFNSGASGNQWPFSRHNQLPSLAVDVAPYPIDWHNIKRFNDLAEIVKHTANVLQIKVIWGGDWKMRDYPHWELSTSILAKSI